jgi:toxin HigB-1
MPIDILRRASWRDAIIKPFNCADTEKLFHDVLAARFLSIERPARRKRPYLHRTQDDLKPPPGNRLEALKGDRKGQHSIRINDQWRICFKWSGGDVYDVEIVDYH